jgi:hypothetical protein
MPASGSPAVECRGGDPAGCARRVRPRHRCAAPHASTPHAALLRQLSWQLEGSGIELLVAPGLIEVAGPRLHIRPFEGLPLLSVEQPSFEGWRRVVKGAVDRLTATVALVLLAPVLLAIAAAVRLTSSGPVLYRQERVGLGGRTFTMLKFRSMVVDADRQLEALRAENISDGLLFKMRTDPRVTPWAGCCAACRWTSCPSCSTCSAAPCRRGLTSPEVAMGPPAAAAPRHRVGPGTNLSRGSDASGRTDARSAAEK